MMTVPQTKELARLHDVKWPARLKNKEARSTYLAKRLTLGQVRDFCSKKRSLPDVVRLIAILESGGVAGHSWHSKAPSYLHLGIQDLVRQVCDGTLTQAQFLRIGDEIMRQELFMVTVAELTENCLIERCDAIPSIIARGVVDLVLDGIPFDVKNVAMPSGWNARRIRAAPKKFAEAMVSGADRERRRKQADTAFDGWTHNRMFVVLADESRWESDPKGVLDAIVARATKLRAPLRAKADGFTFLAHVVVVT